MSNPYLTGFGPNVEFLDTSARDKCFTTTTSSNAHAQRPTTRESGCGRVGTVQAFKQTVFLPVSGGRAQGSGGQLGRGAEAELIVGHIPRTSLGRDRSGCGFLLKLGLILQQTKQMRW